MIGMIAADIERERIGQRRKGMRYLTLTHLANACTDDKAMKVYRQAVIKLLNSLSRSPDVVRFTPIDPLETIIRVNLDELGWTAKDWETILKSYPYKMQPDTQLQEPAGLGDRTARCRMCAATGSPSRHRAPACTKSS